MLPREDRDGATAETRSGTKYADGAALPPADGRADLTRAKRGLIQYMIGGDAGAAAATLGSSHTPPGALVALDGRPPVSVSLWCKSPGETDEVLGSRSHDRCPE